MWYGSVSPIRTHVCLHYSITLWYPHISPSWLYHGTYVSYPGMCPSRIYTIPYSHLSAYVRITLHKARYGPTILTLWYHHINTSRLCYNGTLVWPISPICPMYVISLSSITCVLPASSSIHPSVSRIFPQ